MRGFCCCGCWAAGNNKEDVLEKILNECNTPSPLPSTLGERSKRIG